MKIGVISDIHSNFVALDQVLSQQDIRGASKIFCAGDLVGYYSQPNEVISRIREDRISSVRGNHDDAIVKSTPSSFSLHAKRSADWNRRKLSEGNIKYLKELPEIIEEFIGEKNIFVAHGSPKNPISEYIYGTDVDELFLEFYFDIAPDIVILGHTHKPYVKKVDGTLIVNPGSVGQPRDGDPRASYAIVDLDTLDAQIHRVEYDISRVAKMTAEELPRSLGERLFEGR